MAKTDNLKIRVIAVYRMLSSGKKMSVREIQRELELKFDIQAGRKTIYDDICAVDRFLPIQFCRGENGGYCIHDVFAEQNTDQMGRGNDS